MIKLSDISSGTTAKIISLQTRGLMRKRLYDLGFLPGESVTPLYWGLAGGPAAYRVCGAVIALRREDAAAITVRA